MGEDEIIIDTKLRLEKEILELKRQYKVAFHQTEEAKAEYNSIINSTNKNKTLLEEYKKDLTTVLNDISNARLGWAIEKDNEWQKVANKITEAENVIKRENRLNEKEVELKQIQSDTVDARNEQRQLELKNEAEKNLNEDVKKQLQVKVSEFDKEKESFLKEKLSFKEEVSNFVKKWLQKL